MFFLRGLANRLRRAARLPYYQILQVVAGALPSNCGVILLYHSVTKSSNSLSVTPANFEAQMNFLSAHFEVLPLAEMTYRCSQGKFSTRPLAAITFDDGFQDNLTEAAPILARFKLPVTFFIASGLVGGYSPAEWGEPLPMLSWTEIEELKRQGHSIGGHTVTHPLLPQLSLSRARAEILDNKIDLENRLGCSVEFFAYPVGRYNPLTVELVQSSAFRGAVTTLRRPVNVQSNVFELPRIGIGKYIQFPHYRAFLSRAAYCDWPFWL